MSNKLYKYTSSEITIMYINKGAASRLKCEES